MGLKENLDTDYQAIADVLYNSVLKGKTVFNTLKDTLDYIHKKRLERKLIDIQRQELKREYGIKYDIEDKN